MGIMDTMRDKIRAFLEIDEIDVFKVQIHNDLGFEANAIKNRIWYRGDAHELQALYAKLKEVRMADEWLFWSARSTSGLEIQKRSTGLAGLIVDTLANIVIADFNGIELEEQAQDEEWEDISKDNNFNELLTEALKQALYIGDGAWKISVDASVSKFPIIEFWSGERIEVKLKRGRLREIIFKSERTYNNRKYELHEIYGYGYIRYKLFDGDREVPLESVPDFAELQEIAFDDSYMLAVLMRNGRSDRWEGRGQCIFERKIDSLDALDEIWSQWCDAIRAGRTKEYIPDVLIPRNESTGAFMKPNPFDMRFIKTGTDMSENGQNKITVENPTIQHESYLSSYVTALDLCLQGIISPSTLGIDVKKLDNAEAQREKEKTTLYTRQDIIEMLNESITKLVQACFNAQAGMRGEQIVELSPKLKFGEYANPSFESQVETVGKARAQGIMSIENSVEELYGDSKDDKWKAEEVARLKAEQGIVDMEEPMVASEVWNDYQNSEQLLPNDTQGSTRAS